MKLTRVWRMKKRNRRGPPSWVQVSGKLYAALYPSELPLLKNLWPFPHLVKRAYPMHTLNPDAPSVTHYTLTEDGEIVLDKGD